MALTRTFEKGKYTLVAKAGLFRYSHTLFKDGVPVETNSGIHVARVIGALYPIRCYDGGKRTATLTYEGGNVEVSWWPGVEDRQ